MLPADSGHFAVRGLGLRLALLSLPQRIVIQGGDVRGLPMVAIAVLARHVHSWIVRVTSVRAGFPPGLLRGRLGGRRPQIVVAGLGVRPVAVTGLVVGDGRLLRCGLPSGSPACWSSEAPADPAGMARMSAALTCLI